ncbi:MAG: hypothetical protein HUJ74_00635 [Lachnospiraceae bacterium]|nr:hypothetical protein [Lachnospiraceae bacterium]
MKQLVKGMYARSLAGHDKGRLYIIIEANEIYVYLSDGKIRPLDKLKKKKLKHIQSDYGVSVILQERIGKHLPLRNEDIRKAIKLKEV